VKRFAARAGGLLLAAAFAGAAAAQTGFPDKPLHLVVPFSPGGTVDRVARVAATELAHSLGVTVIVDNVPGAGGTLATARVAKAPADGSTLLFTTPNHTINPALIAKLPFDTERDFMPLARVAEIPELLVANASQPYGDVAGFVKAARAAPGRLTYASAGNGTLPHVTMELLLQRLGVQLVHVPYKGAAPALNDLIAGQVAVKMDTVATSLQHVQSGRVKPLAIASEHRSPLLPQVPTLAESGVPGYRGILWMGVLAPTGTPRPVADAITRALLDMTRQPELQRRLQGDGVDVVSEGPEAFGRLIAAEIRQWAEVVRKAQIKGE
jgi:tripartite-type tricarboxylate transporter receptor subunit TctC